MLSFIVLSANPRCRQSSSGAQVARGIVFRVKGETNESLRHLKGPLASAVT